jgi:hypothetical protein
MVSKELSKILEGLIQRVEECMTHTVNEHDPCKCNKSLAIKQIEQLIKEREQKAVENRDKQIIESIENARSGRTGYDVIRIIENLKR